MTKPERISAEDARELERSGKGLLVCAYDDEEKFTKNRLEGATPLSELRAMKSRLDQKERIVFY